MCVWERTNWGCRKNCLLRKLWLEKHVHCALVESYISFYKTCYCTFINYVLGLAFWLGACCASSWCRLAFSASQVNHKYKFFLHSLTLGPIGFLQFKQDFLLHIGSRTSLPWPPSLLIVFAYPLEAKFPMHPLVPSLNCCGPEAFWYVPLSYGSRSWSFCMWLFRCQQKISFFISFFAYYSWSYIYIYISPQR